MHELLPDGEEIRRAVKWISSHLSENPDQRVQSLVQEAIFKFDLSPLEAEFLIGFYSRNKEEDSVRTSQL
ncbi:MAG: hypothetical protein PHH28_09135 [Desulfuromonadaceae bacterium]|nr:hypothetical protein [Desulfuromonadaceae bacterium]